MNVTDKFKSIVLPLLAAGREKVSSSLTGQYSRAFISIGRLCSYN